MATNIEDDGVKLPIKGLHFYVEDKDIPHYLMIPAPKSPGPHILVTEDGKIIKWVPFDHEKRIKELEDKLLNVTQWINARQIANENLCKGLDKIMAKK
jgi:hypothetical protein